MTFEELRNQIRAGKFKPSTIRLLDEPKSEHARVRAANLQAEYETRVRLKTTLEEMFHFQEHHKRDRLWQIAWEDAHSEGYEAVAHRYAELAQLLTPVNA